MVFDGDDLICTGDISVMKLRDARRGTGLPMANRRFGPSSAIPNTARTESRLVPTAGSTSSAGTMPAFLKSTPQRPTRRSRNPKPARSCVSRPTARSRKSSPTAFAIRTTWRSTNTVTFLPWTPDGERDQHLPWYTPTRLFDVAQGMHHGWVLTGWKRSWNRPEYFFDNVPRLVEIGRGSPTGVEVYRHRQYPRPYRGSVFSCCWTLGRVYHFPLEQKGSSYESRKEIFLETTGDVGFAPVDLAVGPKGDLFVAIGGRGTRGSVFRVTYTKAERLEPPTDPLKKILGARTTAGKLVSGEVDSGRQSAGSSRF